MSYFPDSLAKDAFNPASMFISFISAKDFFTIIDRKIIENYKLNMFDLSFDVFEWKLWLWIHKDMMQSKMTDAYYSYIAAANFNWYKFYSVWNTATGIVLLCSLYFYDLFDKERECVFVDVLYAFYLLTFLFAARIKVFPWMDKKSDFQWFVDLYFNFLESVISQLRHEIPRWYLKKLRTRMLEHIDVFFMMFYYEKRVNNLYIDSSKTNEKEINEFYQWLFWSQVNIVKRKFLQNIDKITHDSNFWDIEQNLLFDVVPADINIKYLFFDTEIGNVVSKIVSNVFDKKLLDKKLTSLMKNEDELNFLLDYVTDPDNFKKWFFRWVKQYVSYMRLQNQDSYEMLDEMMSEIWDDINKLDEMKIPASIKKESRIMEQFLNFYTSYLWWLFISRANTFFFRFFKWKLIPELVQYFDVSFKTDQAIQYSSMSHLVYIKNQAYYQFVNKKIRSWKEKFFIPVWPIKTDSISATAYLLQSQDEIALSTLLQDCNPRVWKLYVKNKALLDWFQNEYSWQISQLIKLSSSDFIHQYYEPIFSNFKLWENVLKILQNAFTEQDVVRLKNSLYAFDVQLFYETIVIFPWKRFQNLYNDTVILQHLALLRETLFWFLIYYRYLQNVQEQNKVKLDLLLLKKVYILHILNWDVSLFSLWSKLIDYLLGQFWMAFSTFVEFDDNKEFFSILKENWIDFLKKIWIEDFLRLRGVLKHITYYNKRYLIPN